MENWEDLLIDRRMSLTREFAQLNLRVATAYLTANRSADSVEIAAYCELLLAQAGAPVEAMSSLDIIEAGRG